MKILKFYIICGLFIFISSSIPSLVLANNWSGQWKGSLTSSDDECGFEQMQATMNIDGSSFKIKTADAAGPVTFKGNVIDDTVTQKIIFHLVTEVGDKDENSGQLQGKFFSNEGGSFFKGGFYIEQMSDGGYSSHMLICEVKLNLKRDKIDYQNSYKKSEINNRLEKKVAEIKQLLNSRLITKTQYDKIVGKIYKKEQTNKRKNQSKQFEEAIAKIKNLLKDGLISKKEYSSLREKLIDQHLGLTQ